MCHFSPSKPCLKLHFSCDFLIINELLYSLPPSVGQSAVELTQVTCMKRPEHRDVVLVTSPLQRQYSLRSALPVLPPFPELLALLEEQSSPSQTEDNQKPFVSQCLSIQFIVLFPYTSSLFLFFCNCLINLTWLLTLQLPTHNTIHLFNTFVVLCIYAFNVVNVYNNISG